MMKKFLVFFYIRRKLIQRNIKVSIDQELLIMKAIFLSFNKFTLKTKFYKFSNKKKFKITFFKVNLNDSVS